ncbi:MAG: hypothetical protein R3E39_10675 [Anaerolineae bacterium]
MRWILVLLTAIISGVLVGLALFFLDAKLHFYLVLIFPMLGGIIIGAATYLPVVTKQVATLPLIIAAFIGCAIAVAIYWGGQYLTYQDELVATIQETDPTATREQALELVGEFEESVYQTRGFVAFLKAYAETGITINRATSSSDSGIELKDNLAYGFWIVEIILMVGAAIVGIVRREQGGLAKRFNPQAGQIA